VVQTLEAFLISVAARGATSQVKESKNYSSFRINLFLSLLKRADSTAWIAISGNYGKKTMEVMVSAHRNFICIFVSFSYVDFGIQSYEITIMSFF
jgi:hypothetical protein